MEYKYGDIEKVLHTSFVAEAIALKTGLSHKEVHERIAELTADAFIGRAVHMAGAETAGIVASIAEEMMK